MMNGFVHRGGRGVLCFVVGLQNSAKQSTRVTHLVRINSSCETEASYHSVCFCFRSYGYCHQCRSARCRDCVCSSAPLRLPLDFPVTNLRRNFPLCSPGLAQGLSPAVGECQVQFLGSHAQKHRLYRGGQITAADSCSSSYFPHEYNT